MTRRGIATFVSGALLGAAVLMPVSGVAQDQGAQKKAPAAPAAQCPEEGAKDGCCKGEAAAPAPAPVAKDGCCQGEAAPTVPVKDQAAPAAPAGECGGCEGEAKKTAETCPMGGNKDACPMEASKDACPLGGDKEACCGGGCGEMDAWMAAGMPGESHKKLEPMVGSWNVTQKFWMEPGKEPVETQATSEHTWALGGRFVEQRFTGTMPGMDTSFEGRGFTGFDNVTGKFVGTWMDSLSTAMLSFEGTVSPCGKVLTFRGEQAAPGDKLVKYRYEVRIESADRHTFTMWQSMGDAPEVKVMEAVYSKRAAPTKK